MAADDTDIKGTDNKLDFWLLTYFVVITKVVIETFTAQCDF